MAEQQIKPGLKVHQCAADTNSMPRTRTQVLRLVETCEAAGTIAPDRSEIIAQLEGGWTLRRMRYAGDFRREGELMSSCCASYVPRLVPSHADFTMADRPDLLDDQRELQLVSLRDKDNLPHATAWLLPGHHLFAVWGRGERNKLSAPKAQLLKRWCAETGVEWDGISEGEGWAFFTTMRGVCSVVVDPEMPRAPWHASSGNAREAVLGRLREIGQLAGEYQLLCDPAIDHLADMARELARIIERNELNTHRLEQVDLFERDLATLIEYVASGEAERGAHTWNCNRPPMCKSDRREDPEIESQAFTDAQTQTQPRIIERPIELLAGRRAPAPADWIDPELLLMSEEIAA